MRTISAGLVFLSLMFIQRVQPTGRVVGTVFDETYAALPNTKVTFKPAAGFERMVMSDERGHYEIILPEGMFRITTSYPGFESEKRAPFEVVTGSDTLINVRLLVATMDGPLTLARETVLKSGKHPSTPILVRYDRRTKVKEFTQYHGRPKLVEWRQETTAVLTFGVLAVYADLIRIKSDSSFVTAIGDVVVEDGKRQRKGNEVTIDLDAADPIASIRLQ